MEIQLKSFHYLCILVSLAGVISVSAQTESPNMTTVSTTEDDEVEENMTSTMAEATSGEMTETVTWLSQEDSTATTASDEGGTDQMVSNNATTQMLTMKRGTTDGSTTIQCYECMSEAGTDEDGKCAAKQNENSDTTDCDGNCLITAFYGESDEFVNVSRSCSMNEEECNDMNTAGFECKDVETDDVKKMCSYCCSEDKCNSMSDASDLRFNGVMLMVFVFCYGIFYYKIF